MSYFDEFGLSPTRKVVGIPNVQMNAPLCARKVTGDVGIEFEIEAVDGYQLPWGAEVINDGIEKGRWTAKEDNSLRNGVEYITSGAIPKELVRPMMTSLYKNLTATGVKLRFSNRCSTHVHLNVSGWKIDKIVNLYVLWAMYEEVLVKWCGPKRQSNHFCLSISDSTNTLDGLTYFLKKGTWAFNDGDKYSALNVGRLQDLGSLEVRVGDAYPDPERAIQWVSFLAAMREVALSLDDPSQIPSMVSGDTPTGLFAEICNKGEAPLLYQEVVSAYDRNLDNVCYAGLRETLHLCNLPWDEWRPLIDEEYVANPFRKVKKSPVRGLEPMPEPANGPQADWRALEELQEQGALRQIRLDPLRVRPRG